MRNRILFFYCLKEKLLSIWYMTTQNNPKTSQLDTFDIMLSHERFARVSYVGCEVTCIIINRVSRVSHWLRLPYTNLLRYLMRVSTGEPYREDSKPDVTRLVIDLDYSDSSVWWDIMKTVVLYYAFKGFSWWRQCLNYGWSMEEFRETPR